ncbi:CPBP family intramembrane glutamic endopeptidase [Pseudarthrobacter sp. P1]|uniref:CPBP family intramembrane glutamic endopeptidase n=1 Tax=Pseudarthrobacter sp. P1 TaxID=3418418 RepID=UPI003CEC45CA
MSVERNIPPPGTPDPGGSGPPAAGSRRARITAHPVMALLIPLISLTWLAQCLAIWLLGDITPGLIVELVLLLGLSVLVTAAANGRAGIKRLFGGVVRWRVGAGWYVVALVAVPALTLLAAAVTGTLREPGQGWAAAVGLYLVQAVVIGALLGNVWEELAWAGVVQRRLMERRGVLTGSLLTAIPFALIHLPQAFADRGFAATPWTSVAISWGILFGFALVLRYLMGMVYSETGGSILILGLLHGSMNASGRLDPVDGGWQYIPALVVLMVVVAVYRAARSRAAAVVV